MPLALLGHLNDEVMVWCCTAPFDIHRKQGKVTMGKGSAARI